jgi:hypothetical protein
MQQHPHELFPLQTLVKRNHVVTPMYQSVKLYSIIVNLEHEADGVKLTLSPIAPILKHCVYGERPEGCTGDVFLLKYNKKTYNDEVMTIDPTNDTLVVRVGTNHLSSFLDTLAEVARFYHVVHEYMVRAVKRAVSVFYFGIIGLCLCVIMRAFAERCGARCRYG